MKEFFRFSLGLFVGYWACVMVIHIWPAATMNYYDGWIAGQELCKATDETPINQPRPLAETLRRK